MDTAGDDVGQRDGRGDVSRRRPRTTPGGAGRRGRSTSGSVARLLVVTAGLVLGPLVLLPLDAVPAVAATSTLPGAGTSPAPTQPPTFANPVPAPGAPSPSPTRTPVAPPSSGAPTAPTITDPGDITTDLARFSGRATPGHGVRVADPAVPSASVCRTTTRPDGTWSCVGTVHSGPAQVFTVLDTTTSSLPSVDAAPSDVIVPPVVATRQPTTGAVAGTGRAGATVTVTRAGSPAVRTATVGPTGTWHVSWGVGPGAPADGTFTVTATQTASTADGYRSDLRSAVSAPRSVTIDRTPPAAPRISTPAAASRVDARSLRIAGSAEAGTIVTAYVDDVAVCRSEVTTAGSWSCRVADVLRPGSHRVGAGAQDVAGNTSRSASAVTVRVGGPSAAGSGGPTGASDASGAPSSGRGPTTGTTPGAGAGDGTGRGGAAGRGAGSGPDGGDDRGSAGGLPGGGTDGGHGGRPDWSGPAGDWSIATTYDHAVPTIQSSFSWRTLAIAAGAAVAFLLLVAGPVRALAGALRVRAPGPASRFTGRNRPRSERTRGDDALPAWASVGIGVALAGLLALLSTGIALEARYVRLALGVVAGVAVLTAGVVLATRWAAGEDRRAVTFRVSPWLVLAAVVASGLTRVADLSPALVVGVLLVPVGRTDVDTAAMRLGNGVAACARSATWRSVTLLVIAAAGWVLHSVTPSAGFAGSLASEFASTLCVGALGSLVVTLLPLRGSAGAALASVSRPRYAALAAVAVGLAAAVYSGPTGTHVPVAAMASGIAVLVVLGAAAWVWLRHQERAQTP
ncbi:Ig-like domain-containing protein [Curtobacterium sp. MCBD17_021]|uniref:Ig-like domain-containing protein n=1 Tax=Curtobacterium sp. MCBD17_021 TaxID=2175665 RepID=UPI0015E8A258|nr:Ig-like domain-containing protein [Curtobacterium sp. MCBD17_021]